jgi:hypothetical protein
MSFRNEHNLIAREQTYVLDRKLLTVHSEDRDISKWPHSNHFEIMLPQTYTNVQSLQLVECNFPTNNYTFCNDYQNTKLSFRVSSSPRSNPIVDYYLSINSTQYYTIEIQEGFYSPAQLAREIQYRMNQAVTAYLKTPGEGIAGAGAASTYEHFHVYYDDVGQKMWFGNDCDAFFLSFNRREYYELGNCDQPNVWDRYTKWGLPAYLGFTRQEYPSNSSTTTIKFSYNASPDWLIPVTDVSGVTAHCHYIASPYTLGLFGETAVYMEIDKCNMMDELMPYSEATSNMYNNDFNGTINAIFAKVPIAQSGNSQYVDSKNVNLVNFSHFYPPIDKMRKLKFKFRYHDGRLVNFKEANFNFTISINCLRDEIARDLKLRTPGMF